MGLSIPGSLAAEEQVQEDGEDYRDDDHKTYRGVEREVTSPESEVPRQPVDPEAPEQQEDAAEHQQHDRPADEQFACAFQTHTLILCVSGGITSKSWTGTGLKHVEKW